VSARGLILLLALLPVSGCAQTSLTRLHFIETQEGPDRPGTYLGLPLKTGQVVLSEAPGPYSLLFSLGPDQPHDFTHAAVLVMEQGEPFIYEMTGEYNGIGLEDRPTEGIEGMCRRVPLLEYCQGYLFVEIFDPPAGVDGEKVAAYARARLADETPFDVWLNYEDQGELFCTEFVQMALEAGGAPPIELTPVRQQPSLQRLLDWLGVDSDRCVPAGIFADPARSAAALGLLPTRTAATAYFEAKAELHRRFTDDQLLGNVFEMSGMADITVRPAVYRFQQHAASLFQGQQKPPTREVIRTAVRSLAEQLFGVAGPAPERVGAQGPSSEVVEEVR
jgi:hypothetical protein